MGSEKIIENNDKLALADELQVYELGFHLFPNIAPEFLSGEVSDIKSVIEKNGGLFIGEESLPKSIRLAYPISKKINNKKMDFDTAYFGWVKFEAAPDAGKKIKESLKEKENILRFLLLKSFRQSSMISAKKSSGVFFSPEVKKGAGEKGELSEKQVDEAIEGLIGE